MTLFSIDEALCQKDGLCARDCPVSLIELPDGQSPRPIPNAEALCIDCGHCVSVCPHGALTHRAMAPSDCLPILPEHRLSPDQAEAFIRERRSIRRFDQKPVERETIQRLIEIARHAPSGHNRQPVQWLVLEQRSAVERMAGLTVDWMRWLVTNQGEAVAWMRLDRIIDGWDRGKDGVTRRAPGLIVPHAPAADRTAAPAATLALGALELAAPSFGVGTCWAGYVWIAAAAFPPLQQALDLPEGHAALGAMMIGTPRSRYYRMPARRPPVITWR